MRTIIIAAALVAATVSTASASCGGEWSFSGGITEKDIDKSERTYGTYGGFEDLYDDRNEYNVGIRFSMPFGMDDCEKVRAQTAKLQAEERYAEQKAAKEEEFAISKRIDNLQRIIVTCKTEDLPICSKIPQMSMEIFN